MGLFFSNTDAGSPPTRQGRSPVLIRHGLAVTGGPSSFGEQLGKLSPGDTLLMYENGVGVVAGGTVRDHWDRITYRQAIYYQFGDEGFDCEYRIGVDWHLDLSESPASFRESKDRLGYIPQGAIRLVVAHQAEVERIIEEARAASLLLPGDIARPASYVEGATRQVSVNAYERSRGAVIRCKAVRGTTCVVCGFDFSAVYGPEFAGFIHIHHLRPLSEVGGQYVVDPATGLSPVCPNCHAAIHYGGRLRSIEEVRQLMGRQQVVESVAASEGRLE